MFDTLLIANRGEIACRVMRTAKALGIRTVAVYSDADAHAAHVREADRAVRIGPAAAVHSYLDIDRIIDAARKSGARAIHPGYGFLAENAAFARACDAAGIVFVGPPAAAIEAMGSKIEAKRLVAAAGTPVVPGYHGDQHDAVLAEAAAGIGFPLLIKASAGGGGKGMRLVTAADGFEQALAAARREAKAAFGDDAVLLERYLAAPKHIEVQILADVHGNTVHLFERDCSVQRRHQKVIEEAPAPTVDAKLRAALGAAAVRAVNAVGYVGAGTVEFICEGDEFYFMEMNTRLQVEHPVTEAITGLDLVAWQLKVAAGEVLGFGQQDLAIRGHSIEARLYAENPRKRFLPSTGRLERLAFPPGIRVDAGVAEGDTISMHYDPMIAKLIAHGSDRSAAIATLEQAIAQLRIAGIDHNAAYLRAVLRHPAFRDGRYTTRLGDDHQHELIPPRAPGAPILAALYLRERARGTGPWAQADGFRVNLRGAYARTFARDRETVNVRLCGDTASLDGSTHTLSGVRVVQQRVSAWIDGIRADAELLEDGDTIHVMLEGDTERLVVERLDASAFTLGAAAGERVLSPMPGQVVSVAVTAGERVRAEQVLVVVEAMKMEHSIRAPRAATVAAVHFAAGDRVQEGAELISLADE